MKRDAFKPETDFEKVNLDLIEKLRLMEDEELSEDFDSTLFERVRGMQPQKKKELNIFRIFTERPSYRMTFAYAASVIIISGAALIFYYNHSSSTSQPSIAKTENTVHEKSTAEKNTAAPANEEKKKPEVSQAGKDSYLAGLHSKVTENMSYGFASAPSLKDVKKALYSEDFKKMIGGVKSPSVKDTVRIIVRILEDKQ